MTKHLKLGCFELFKSGTFIYGLKIIALAIWVVHHKPVSIIKIVSLYKVICLLMWQLNAQGVFTVCDRK